MKLFKPVDFAVFPDSRGELREVFTQQSTHALDIMGFHHALFVDSHQDVLRGLHFQRPAQGKYVVVLEGIITLLGLDLRSGSPSYGKLDHQTVYKDFYRAWWLPPGCAFGYRTHTPSRLMYFLSRARSRDEFAIRFFDNSASWDSLATAMVQNDLIMSEKDTLCPTLGEYEAAGILPLCRNDY